MAADPWDMAPRYMAAGNLPDGSFYSGACGLWSVVKYYDIFGSYSLNYRFMKSLIALCRG